MLTGNIGKPGAGCYTWAGNYKAALFQGLAGDRPGLQRLGRRGPVRAEPRPEGRRQGHQGQQDHQGRGAGLLEPRRAAADRRHAQVRPQGLHRRDAHADADEVPLVRQRQPVQQRQARLRHALRGQPEDRLHHRPGHGDDQLVRVRRPRPPGQLLDGVPDLEITASCSNPFLHIWKGGIKPVHDTATTSTSWPRSPRRWPRRPATSASPTTGSSSSTKGNGAKVYIQRLLDGSTTTTAATRWTTSWRASTASRTWPLMLFRTYPRIPFWEKVHDDLPFWTDTGRLNAYCDIPEAIEYGENFIVHREGPEATPYLPNVIVSTNPLVRPDDYGIPRDAMHWDERTVRNVKLPWRGGQDEEPAVGAGLPLLPADAEDRGTASTRRGPRWTGTSSGTRTSATRTAATGAPAGVGDHQLHMNPEDGRRLGHPRRRLRLRGRQPRGPAVPGVEATDDGSQGRALMLRVTYNTSYPSGVMTKHAPFIATEKTVLAHETRGDGRCRLEDTGYQANFRYGSHQSSPATGRCRCTRPTRLFHKDEGDDGLPSSAARRTTTPSTPCRRRRWSGSSRRRTAARRQGAVGAARTGRRDAAKPGHVPGVARVSESRPRWWTTRSAGTSGTARGG